MSEAKKSELEIRREGPVVYVRPELVVEVAFNGLQTSPHYPAGLALGFARLVRYRVDKRAEDADTIETVRRVAGAAPGTSGSSGRASTAFGRDRRPATLPAASGGPP